MPLDGGDPVPIAEVQGNAIFEIYPYGDFVYGWCGMENVTYLFVYDPRQKKRQQDALSKKIFSFLYRGKRVLLEWTMESYFRSA